MKIVNRIKKLEQAVQPPRARHLVWADPDESEQGAVSRFLADHKEAKPGDHFTVISWQGEDAA